MTNIVNATIAVTLAGCDPRGLEPTSAYPLRFWWLKRLALAAVLLVVLMLAVRLGWGHEADRRLRRALAPAVARGEPIWPADFTPPPGAIGEVEENGATFVMRAASAVSRTAESPANTGMDFPEGYTPWSPRWHDIAAPAVAANAAVFPLARKARAFDRFDWDVPFTMAGVTAHRKFMGDVRMLVSALSDSAEYAHDRGDDVAALETIRDMRHAARGVRSGPLLLSHLVGVGTEAAMLCRVYEIAPGLRIIPATDAAMVDAVADRAAAFPSTRPVSPPRGVSPENVLALAAELMDTREQTRSLVRSFAGERAMVLAAADGGGARTWLLRPMWQLDAARTVDGYEAMIDAAWQPDWPAAKASLAGATSRMPARLPRSVELLLFGPPATTGAKREPIDFTRLLGSTYAGGLGNGRVIEQSLRVAAERKMAAVSLAAQVYRAEHGEWPATIEALVPKYLPEVPLDPLAANGGRLHYALLRSALPDGRDRPLVYSAGRDGLFDPIEKLVPPNVPAYGWTQGNDEWRDLARWRPLPPTTAPGRGSGRNSEGG